MDEATAARVLEARAAKARDAAEAARRRAMARNPADVLRETTRAGGAAYDPMTLKPYETLNPTNPTPGLTRAALERFALDVAPDESDESADAARARRRSPCRRSRRRGWRRRATTPPPTTRGWTCAPPRRARGRTEGSAV